MPNADLLRRTLAHIEEHPEQWEQEMWATRRLDCGTTCCFAGWAVALSGGKPDFPDEDWDTLEAYRIVPGSVPGIAETRYAEVARQLLGLDKAQSDLLFSEANELDDLRRIVAQLTADPEPAATP